MCNNVIIILFQYFKFIFVDIYFILYDTCFIYVYEIGKIIMLCYNMLLNCSSLRDTLNMFFF